MILKYVLVNSYALGAFTFMSFEVGIGSLLLFFKQEPHRDTLLRVGRETWIVAEFLIMGLAMFLMFGLQAYQEADLRLLFNTFGFSILFLSTRTSLFALRNYFKRYKRILDKILGTVCLLFSFTMGFFFSRSLGLRYDVYTLLIGIMMMTFFIMFSISLSMLRIDDMMFTYLLQKLLTNTIVIFVSLFTLLVSFVLLFSTEISLRLINVPYFLIPLFVIPLLAFRLLYISLYMFSVHIEKAILVITIFLLMFVEGQFIFYPVLSPVFFKISNVGLMLVTGFMVLVVFMLYFYIQRALEKKKIKKGN